MAQHRYRTAALIGKWRLTRKEACRDAINAGQARHDPEDPDGMTWALPAVIEMTGVD
jgi:hypothetical protein